MSWLEKSLMHTRGISGGKVGKTHELTEKLQGKFQYTMGPYSDPVLKIDPGDRVVVETVDAFDGVIKTEKDLPSEKLTMQFVNPQCGPIMVMRRKGMWWPCISNQSSLEEKTRAARYV